MKRCMREDSPLNTRMYWFTLHCLAELHLSWLHREKCTKNPTGGVQVASCHFLRLGPIGRVTSADTDLQGVLLSQTQCAEARPLEDTWCSEGIEIGLNGQWQGLYSAFWSRDFHDCPFSERGVARASAGIPVSLGHSCWLQPWVTSFKLTFCYQHYTF